MPFPCCNYCYVKYLEEDGKTVIKEELATAIEQNVEFRKQNNYPPLPVVTPEELLDSGKLCTCFCHVRGQQVLH